MQIVGPISSVYRWKGELSRDSELLLLIKTRGDLVPAIETRLAELHPYEVPELLAQPVACGGAAYLAWVDASLGGGAPGA